MGTLAVEGRMITYSHFGGRPTLISLFLFVKTGDKNWGQTRSILLRFPNVGKRPVCPGAHEDGSPVARVAIDVDGTPIGDATLGSYRVDVGNYYNRSDYNYSGYQFVGNIQGPSLGTHTVHATAYDWAGNASTLLGSTQITVTANQAPFGYLDDACNQANGTTTIPQGGTLYVQGWAVDPDSSPGAPVNKVEIRVDGALWGTAGLGDSRSDVAAYYNRSDYTLSGWHQTFSIGNLSPGTHTVTATAYDSLGGSAVIIDDHQFTVTGSNPGTPNPPAGPILYSYDLYYSPNGNVVTGNDLVNGVWNYGYDGFNRLGSAQQPGQGFTYAYDRFGNRWSQTLTNGQGPQPSYSFDAANHITNSGMSYDALGNVTNDGLGNTYTYDAENRLVGVNGITYIYDALGRRVAKQSGGVSTEEYLYDLNNRVETIFNGSGVWAYGEVYAGGRHLATYSGATTNFLHMDWLGNKRAMTSVSGTLSETCSSLPFGDGGNCTGANWGYNNFTDDFHDFDSNTEHTQFRQLSTTQGRWLSPDPWLGSMDLTNPQSLNRYAYVMNNPLSFTDRSGLCPDLDYEGLDDSGNYFVYVDTGPCPGWDDSNPNSFIPTVWCDSGCSGSNGPLFPGGGGTGPSGGGSGGGGGKNGTQANNGSVKQKICSAIPEGRTVGVSGSIGLIGGETGTVEIVTNFNTGEVSAFASGGLQVGFNGGAAANVLIGGIRNLGATNANYSGPFTNGAASIGPVGGFVAASSAGLNNPLKIDPRGAQAAGVTAGVSLVGAATVTASVTNYTQPLPLGNFVTGLAPSFGPFDYLLFAARQLCK